MFLHWHTDLDIGEHWSGDLNLGSVLVHRGLGPLVEKHLTVKLSIKFGVSFGVSFGVKFGVSLGTSKSLKVRLDLGMSISISLSLSVSLAVGLTGRGELTVCLDENVAIIIMKGLERDALSDGHKSGRDGEKCEFHCSVFLSL